MCGVSFAFERGHGVPAPPGAVRWPGRLPDVVYDSIFSTCLMLKVIHSVLTWPTGEEARRAWYAPGPRGRGRPQATSPMPIQFQCWTGSSLLAFLLLEGRGSKKDTAPNIPACFAIHLKCSRSRNERKSPTATTVEICCSTNVYVL